MANLIHLFKRRKREFEGLLGPNLDHLYHLAYRFTGNRTDAEDLVQDLLVKLYPRRGELAAIEQLKPWLTRTLYHLFIDQRRQAGRTPVTEQSDPDATAATDPATDPESATETTLQQRRIEGALKKLNPDQRALVALHDIEGYALPELERLLGTPIGTLKSRLHRARVRLREELEPEMKPFDESVRLEG
ncbi:RNA polymerase sigma factor [Thiohalomonas denitrificans]|uniref:RNA polymerase sigma factor n=1 Tax=Thiohalomonas denitrificans TaxID=415747 RepID=UPI0026ECD1E7|nr:RNA polymerase sigma factor [Thiohalomonas denitrificans]